MAKTERQEVETVSKMEAVRRILADDPEMKPAEGVDAVKRRFGLDMSTANFSAYKSQIRSKAAKRGRKPRGTAARQHASGDAVEAAKAVKDLVDRFGADTVKGLAELFGQETHG